MRKKFKVITPEGYEKLPLPFFNEWVNALESGNYIQGRCCLVSINSYLVSINSCTTYQSTKSYCCLGVLCEIQGRLIDGRDANVQAYRLNSCNPCFSILGDSGIFPTGVQVYDSFAKSPYFSLMGMNDSGNFTFQEIAQVIKEIWKPE